MRGSKFTNRGNTLKGVGDSSQEKGEKRTPFELMEWPIKENLARGLGDGRNLGMVCSL